MPPCLPLPQYVRCPNSRRGIYIRRIPVKLTLSDVAARGGIIKSEYTVLYGVIGLIFFINGMQLSPVKIKQHITNWRLHATVQGTSFLVIPVIMLGELSAPTREAEGD